jgi:hypothetical protein
VYWFLASELSEEEQRKYIGNCLAMVIFNTDGDAFDPSEIDFGSVACIICVVTPRDGKYKYEYLGPALTLKTRFLFPLCVQRKDHEFCEDV